ncbi:MAG: PepSY domain-containing protein [Dechloromonas sp.]|nr:PepSY domain-containing protein [Dechloromonas sp.]
MRRVIIASLLATAGFFPAASHAQDIRSTNADRAKWLSIPEVHARLEAAGYRNIEKIERESGSYEVKATDPAGRRMKLYVHPQTGAVIDQRQRDGKRDRDDSDHARNGQRSSADCNERRCRDDLPQQGAARPAAGK